MHHTSDQIQTETMGRDTAGNAPPLRVGIIGCGRVSETCHLPVLRDLGRRVQVVAVADVDEHRRRRVAGMFDIAQAFPDAETLLSDAGASIDAIVVCSPAEFHADAVVGALRAGKHVLVEKPLALKLDDADRMTEQAKLTPHLKAMLGFNLRHHRLVKKARQMIAGGLIGETQLVRTLWTSGIRYRMKLPPWRNRRQTGGGVLSEIAGHHVDLLRYVTGM